MSAIDLHDDIKHLRSMVYDLDVDVQEMRDGYSTGPGLEPDLIAWAMLEEIRGDLATIARDLTQVLAKNMPARDVVVEGAGTFRRSKKKDRTQWSKEDLLRSVLDTRMFDPNSGEEIYPTPLDKVLHVWNLGTPRLTALRDRGLDPDEFAHVEDAGWAIQLIS